MARESHLRAASRIAVLHGDQRGEEIRKSLSGGQRDEAMTRILTNLPTKPLCCKNILVLTCYATT